jgi:hypothetical protein
MTMFRENCKLIQDWSWGVQIFMMKEKEVNKTFPVCIRSSP